MDRGGMHIRPRGKHREAAVDRTTDELQNAEGLIGTMFTTPKDLRHLAEQALGQLFVPVEVVVADAEHADMVLRPAGMGEIIVHAERERHWYPYLITRIEHVDRDAPAPAREEQHAG
jgi:hypothetical protein